MSTHTARRTEKLAADELFRQESSVDKFARAFCHRYGISWGGISPTERDDMRNRIEELLTYIDSTSFRGYLPTTENGEGMNQTTEHEIGSRDA